MLHCVLTFVPQRIHKCICSNFTILPVSFPFHPFFLFILLEPIRVGDFLLLPPRLTDVVGSTVLIPASSSLKLYKGNAIHKLIQGSQVVIRPGYILAIIIIQATEVKLLSRGRGPLPSGTFLRHYYELPTS